MRATAVAPIFVAIFIALSGLTALSQSALAQAGPDRDDVGRILNEGEQFQNVCSDLRTTGTTALVPGNEPFFLKAIARFCASGEFVLTGTAESGCGQRAQLTQVHVDFIWHLSRLRSQPAQQITLECVTASGLNLRLVGLETYFLQLSDVETDGLQLTQVKVSGALAIERSKLKGELRLLNVAAAGPLEISNSELGSLKIVQSALDSVSLTSSAVQGNFDARDAKIDRSLVLDKSSIAGTLDIRGATLGGALFVNDTTIRGDASLSYLKADRVQISKATFVRTAAMEHAVINTQILIDNGSSFESYLLLNFLRANEVLIERSSIQNLYASYAKLASLLILDSAVAPPDCARAECNFSLFNAEIDYLRAIDARIRSLIAANGRMRILLIAGAKSVLGQLICGDCKIDQSALIAGRITDRVVLTGAEVTGTLAFHEDANRVSWAENARLDLAEFRADAIAADACDLVVDRKEEQGRHTFVPTNLTGARYRAIVSGRGFGMAPTAGEGTRMHDCAWEGRALLDLPAAELKRFLAVGTKSKYNPQPYEQLAQALAGSGKLTEASEIRIARINAWLGDPDVQINPIVRGFYAIYYYISNYGFKNWIAFVWFLTLVLLGALVYLLLEPRRRSLMGQLGKRGELGAVASLTLYGLWFSLDRAVPIMLDPQADDRFLRVDKRLPRGVRHYFYFHRVVGTTLLAVFAAGLVGLGH